MKNIIDESKLIEIHCSKCEDGCGLCKNGIRKVTYLEFFNTIGKPLIFNAYNRRKNILLMDGHDLEDVEQECLIMLWTLVEKKGINDGKYLSTAIKWRIHAMTRDSAIHTEIYNNERSSALPEVKYIWDKPKIGQVTEKSIEADTVYEYKEGHNKQVLGNIVKITKKKIKKTSTYLNDLLTDTYGDHSVMLKKLDYKILYDLIKIKLKKEELYVMEMRYSYEYPYKEIQSMYEEVFKKSITVAGLHKKIKNIMKQIRKYIKEK